MTEIEQQIAAKETELTRISASLSQKQASYKQLAREIPAESGVAQRLMRELAEMRLHCPAPQRATTAPVWYDSAAQPGQMNDRSLKN
jgi:hypothetical protein